MVPSSCTVTIRGGHRSFLQHKVACDLGIGGKLARKRVGLFVSAEVAAHIAEFHAVSAAHKTRLKHASRAGKVKLAAKAVGSAITCASGEASDIVKYSIKALLGALVRVLTDFQSDQHKIIAKELDSHPRLADGQRQCDGTPRAGGQHQPIDGRRPRCDLAEPCCLRVAN